MSGNDNRFPNGCTVRVKDDAVSASSEASWQNGMAGKITLDDAGFEYEVELVNGQTAFFNHDQLVCLQ